MRGTLQLCVALGMVLISGQGGSTLRPGTDSSVTTGIGTGSTFRNVTARPDQPPPDTSRKLFWDTPEAHEAFRQDKAGELDKGPDKGPAPPPPAAAIREDPRTMITRDRIEGPQHR